MLAKNELTIIAGKYKGAKIASPGSIETHPMGAREKLALFNMLQPYLAEARVLDAYAGSGALGLEALSWGAKEVVFVEDNDRAAHTIRQNIKSVMQQFDDASLSVRATLILQRLERYIERPAKADFDLIIADPPYQDYPTNVLALLLPLLAKDGIIALSYPARAGVPMLDELEILTDRHYAAAGIALYRRKV